MGPRSNPARRPVIARSGDKTLLKLGRYEVVRELGKGAMGIVYLAKDPLIGRLVALKTIRVGAHADDDETKEFQQRFIREAQAAGILNHPAIVTVHDIGRTKQTDTSFIAMEYVEGQNLKEVLSQGRALSFEQIADIVAQVAEALDFAHAKGIVHRDVKPANIILIEGNRAKITDFGIAKIASGAANLTTTGQFLGTPNYMAPEQIKGAPVDGRTDIFALGICLYECLTRRKPFGGDSLTSISYKIVHEPFPPLHEINPQIPEAIEEVVAHCLAKDPTKRYQRARDLATALRAVLRGERPTRPPEPMLADETMVTRAAPQPAWHGARSTPAGADADARSAVPGSGGSAGAGPGGSTRPAPRRRRLPRRAPPARPDAPPTAVKRRRRAGLAAVPQDADERARVAVVAPPHRRRRSSSASSRCSWPASSASWRRDASSTPKMPWPPMTSRRARAARERSCAREGNALLVAGPHARGVREIRRAAAARAEVAVRAEDHGRSSTPCASRKSSANSRSRRRRRSSTKA